MKTRGGLALNSLVIICNSGDCTLGIALLDGKSGALSAIETTPFPDATGPTGACPLAVSPDRNILYLSYRGRPSRILSFRINYSTAKLKYLGFSSLPDSMVHISTNMSGRFLFSASYGGGIFAVSAIGPDGIAGEVIQICDAEPKAHCTIPIPDDRFVLIPSIDAEAVLRYHFDNATGHITRSEKPAITLPEGSGPRHLTLHPNGKFAYLVNEINGKVTALKRGENATFTARQTVDITAPHFTGTPSAADIHLTPDGKFLYASDRGSNTIAGYKIDLETGFLNLVCKTPAAETPRGFNIDPTGRWLLSASEKTGTISVYAIDPDGALRKQQDQATGDGPNWVEILPISETAQPFTDPPVSPEIM
ncbi:MAG: lactonase family protein [Paracoccaceae bacterium]